MQCRRKRTKRTRRSTRFDRLIVIILVKEASSLDFFGRLHFEDTLRILFEDGIFKMQSYGDYGDGSLKKEEE